MAQPGDASAQRTLHYPADVQPVLDRHCIECHNPRNRERAGRLDLRGVPVDLFSASYKALMSRIDREQGKLLKEGHKEPVDYQPARSCLSFGTTLAAMHSRGKVRLPDKELARRAAELAEKHRKVELRPEELLKIITWLDANCQYYGSYWGHRHVKYKAHPGFRPNVSFEEALSSRDPLQTR
jgi:hypothetical protein